MSLVWQVFSSWTINLLLLKTTFLPSGFDTQLFKNEEIFFFFQIFKIFLSNSSFVKALNETRKHFLLNVCHFHLSCSGTDIAFIEVSSEDFY